MIRAFTLLVDERAMEIDQELNYNFTPLEDQFQRAIQEYYRQALLRRSQRIETAIQSNAQKDQSKPSVRKEGQALTRRLRQNNSMLTELAESGSRHIRIDEIAPTVIHPTAQEPPAGDLAPGAGPVPRTPATASARVS